MRAVEPARPQPHEPGSKDYVFADVLTKSRLEQIVSTPTWVGRCSTCSGNSVGVNVGYKHREENASFTPSDFEQQGLGRSVAIAPVSGKYNVEEAFGEINVPIISPTNELHFLSSLELFARGR